MSRTPVAARSSRTLSPASQLAIRKTAIDNMPAPLATQFSRIERSINDLRETNLRYYHTLGELCSQVKANPTKYRGVDGTDGLKVIETALGAQGRLIRRVIQFAEAYDKAELKVLIELKNEQNAYQLNWGHVMYLLTIDTKERRAAIAEEAVKKALDPGALHELIQKRFNRSGGHGRSHSMPVALQSQVTQIKKLTTVWIDKSNDVWNGEDQSVFGNLQEATAADVTKELVDTTVELEGKLKELIEVAKGNLEQCTKAREYVQKVFSDAEAARAAAAATGSAGEKRVVRAKPNMAQPTVPVAASLPPATKPRPPKRPAPAA